MKSKRIRREIVFRIAGSVIFLSFAVVPSVFSQDLKTPQPRRGHSQIVDDSTTNVYGPNTSVSATEQALFTDLKTKYAPVDTSIANYHRWTYVQRFNNYYKDLGNNGTALSPIFPILPAIIGVTSGFTSYDPYFETEEPRYFNTRSPYTRLFIVWGGNGRAMTKIEFSRNINPRWNFGFNYRPILSDKQIQYQKADRQTVSHYYDFHTTYHSKSDRYFLLFNFRRLRHRITENGGVKLPEHYTEEQYFDPDAAVNLNSTQTTAAVTEDKRVNFHLFQQLQLAKPAQIYLSTDLNSQVNKFVDNSGTKDFFDYYRGDSTIAIDQVSLGIFQAEAGLKGKAGPLFYNFYYKNRSYQYENQYLSGSGTVLAYKKTGVERYLGGRIALTFDSVTELSGNAEFLSDGNYKLEAFWKSPWIDASGRSSLAKPGLMQQFYYGSHDAWKTALDNITAFQVNGFLKARFGPLFISPGATFSTFTNYVFFRQQPDASVFQQVLPYQSHGTQVIFSPEVRMTLKFLRHFYLRPQVIYTSIVQNDDHAFQIPELFMNAQLAYENSLVKGALIVQIGFDAHWKSDYHALAYDPAIQHFYIQENTTSPSFLLADVFFDAKLKRGKFFVKYHNLVQAFTKVGYIPTPTYQGQHNVLDFGFELILFD